MASPYPATRLNDVLTHLDWFAAAPHPLTDAPGWIARVYDCTRSEAEKLIAAAQRHVAPPHGLRDNRVRRVSL